MIAVVEIVLLVMGLYMLITGRTWSKQARGLKSGHFRALGGFMFSFWILIFGGSLLVGVIYILTHPGATADRFTRDYGTILNVSEIVLAIGYAVTAHLWHNAIIKRLLAQRAGAPPTTITCLDCGYSLTGHFKGKCPNCGRAFDPDNPSSVKAAAPFLDIPPQV